MINNKKSRTIFTETLYMSSDLDIGENEEYIEIIDGFEYEAMPYNICPTETDYDGGKNSVDTILFKSSVDNIALYQNNFQDYKAYFDYYHDYRI